MNVYDLASAINKQSFTLVAYRQNLERVKCEPESKIRQTKLTAAMMEVKSVQSDIDALWSQVLSSCRSKFELAWMEENTYCDYSHRLKIARFKDSEAFALLPNR